MDEEQQNWTDSIPHIAPKEVKGELVCSEECPHRIPVVYLAEDGTDRFPATLCGVDGMIFVKSATHYCIPGMRRQMAILQARVDAVTAEVTKQGESLFGDLLAAADMEIRCKDPDEPGPLLGLGPGMLTDLCVALAAGSYKRGKAPSCTWTENEDENWAAGCSEKILMPSPMMSMLVLHAQFCMYCGGKVIFAEREKEDADVDQS